MIKEALQYLVGLKDNKTYVIDGEDYSDQQLNRIAPVRYDPEQITVSSLDSIVKLITAEQEDIEDQPIFVRVAEYNKVEVFTTYRGDYGRNYLYRSISDTPAFQFNWLDYESAMIAFRSKFTQDDGTEYLLNLLSRITDENSVSSTDNGVTQTVEARKGISLASKETVKSRVALRPFRTFLEVKQPASEFLVRLREGGQIGLFEADGGMWKLTAKQTIKAYFESELTGLIEQGVVIVTA